MNELKVVSINGRLVTESREVAEMIGKKHKDLLRDIRKYIGFLDQSADLRSADFFIKSTYKNKNNQTYPCYLLTKQGCEMVANKLTGERGVLFTAAYVTKFNQMEKELSQPRVLSEKEQLKASMKLSLETSEEVEAIKEDVSMLKNTMRIDGTEEFQIRKLANRKVVNSLGGKGAPAYKELSNKAFARFWRDFKSHFTIPRYGELPKVKFDEGVRFIKAWQPDTSTKFEIEALNRQQVIDIREVR